MGGRGAAQCATPEKTVQQAGMGCNAGDDPTLGGGAGVLIVVRDMDDMVDMDERPPGEVRPPIREEGELRPPSIWSKMKVNPKFGLSQICRLYWVKN